MKIQSHFNLGDKVYQIYAKNKNLFTECPSCDSGYIKLRDDKKMECPQCKCKGLISLKTVYFYVVSESLLTIGQIRFEISNNKYDESYMCEESGVGSGNVYSLSNLYRTKELAQEECDRLNNQESVEWSCTHCNKKYDNIGYDYSIGEWRACEIHGHTRHVDIKKAEVILKQRDIEE